MRPFLGYISLNTYWGERTLSCGVACKFFREFQGCTFYKIVTHAGWRRLSAMQLPESLMFL